MVFPLSTSIYKAIERLMRNFLWSEAEFKQKANSVSWKKICLPKVEGGLGIIKHISDINKAYETRMESS